MSSGAINKSWFTFKDEIFERFRRKVLFSEVMQKVNTRKWIYSKESFQEHSINSTDEKPKTIR